MSRISPTCILSACLVLWGCSREARVVGSTVAQSPPNGPEDRRIAEYTGNAYQIGQGGTYFTTYGCSSCHDTAAPDLRRARLPVEGRLDLIYRAIATGHGKLAYDRRVPAEQLWQIAAFITDLPTHAPEKRRRQAMDQQGEPTGSHWSGPLR